MIRRPPRSTQSRSSAASDVYKRQNLSHRQFWDPELLPTIRSILELHGVPPQCLIIEITESVIMTEPTEARTIMEALHKVGLRLHLDDFGTGPVSYTHLTLPTIYSV